MLGVLDRERYSPDNVEFDYDIEQIASASGRGGLAAFSYCARLVGCRG